MTPARNTNGKWTEGGDGANLFSKTLVASDQIDIRRAQQGQANITGSRLLSKRICVGLKHETETI